MIDKAGRFVLPKPVRERLGLGGRGELELAEIGEGWCCGGGSGGMHWRGMWNNW